MNCNIGQALQLQTFQGIVLAGPCCMSMSCSAVDASRPKQPKEVVSDDKAVEPQTMYTGADILQSKAWGRRCLLFRRPGETNQSSS